MKRLFRVLFTPSCWHQNFAYSKALDKWLLDSLKTHHFEKIGEFTSTINGVELWTANHPYASFSRNSARPSRATILEAWDKLQADSLTFSREI